MNESTRLLLIETSTARCSAALSEDGKVLSHRETEIPKAHASQLCPFIDSMLKENGLSMSDISAVAVSGGPGSYTGLRVGVSTAKGICFGADKPLISVGTMDVLAWQAIGSGRVTDDALIVPMVDARRMEVYARIFSCSGDAISGCGAIVLDSESFRDYQAGDHTLVFIGDGVGKYRQFIEENHPDRVPRCVFIEECPDAVSMITPATLKLNSGAFESSAYYEPFYLKEFVAGVSRKSVL